MWAPQKLLNSSIPVINQQVIKTVSTTKLVVYKSERVLWCKKQGNKVYWLERNEIDLY